jgi:hypothetical protein
MSEILKATLPSLVAALAGAFTGIIVFALGEFGQKFLIEPLHKQKEIIGEIAIQLIYLADVNNVDAQRRRGIKLVPTEAEIEDIEKNLRRLAGQLQASMEVIPKYEWCTRRGWVIPKDSIKWVSFYLVQWSKTIRKGDPTDYQKKITEQLGLRTEALLFQSMNVDEHTSSTKSDFHK